MIKLEPFKLETREAVSQFEKLLDEYLKTRLGFNFNRISLVRAFDSFQDHPYGGRLFTALLDIQINFALLQAEIHGMGSTWNYNFGGDRPKPEDVLTTPSAFFATMDIHKFNTAFVFRYRALWDKIMGFLVMICAYDEYERFRRSKSRRKSFRKIMATIDSIPYESIQNIEQILDDFERKFRTPEAHGTGALRKWSFLAVGADKNPSGELLGYWNIINQIMEGFSATWRKPEE